MEANRLVQIAAEFGTPCYVYDASVIRERVQRLRAFDVIRFAQKACSNIHILRLLKNEGTLVDAVSAGELERARCAGFSAQGDPPGVVFTADLMDRATLERVLEYDVQVNAGSPQMLAQVGERHPGHAVWLRVNPGFGHGHSRKTNTGGEWSKHGIWHTHLDEALAYIDQYKLRLVGLHMHIGSGVEYEHLRRVCSAMVDLVGRLGRDLHAISAGGGLSVPYKGGEAEVDTAAYHQHWHSARQEIEARLGHPVQLELEPGRYLVAEAGVLLAEVRAVKHIDGRRFVLVDAGFDNLVRPAMYGSYHGISFLQPDGSPADGAPVPTVVGGPLCESGDVFTQEEGGVVVPRELPPAKVGDIAVFHNAGAYCSSMASNYNSRPYAPEVLVDGATTQLIRRRQRIDELLGLEQP